MYSVKVLGDYINGRFLRPRKPQHKIVSRDPGDSGYRIGSFPTYPAHLPKAVDAANAAFEGWSRHTQSQRADILRKFSAEIVNRREELKKAIAVETGKPLWEADAEVANVQARVEIEVREGIRSVSPFKVGEVSWGIEGSCRYKPLGVAAVLGAASSPLELACGHIIPALSAGNTVIFKPSKLTPACGQMIASIFDEVDIPRGVFNLLQGDSACGLELAADQAVDAVLFTGSYLAGRHILQATVDQPHKMVALQMGGVNLAVVLSDAALERSVYETVVGSFLSAGQRYSSTGVIMVEKSMFGAFAEAFAETTAQLQVGYSMDKGTFMGPVLSELARERHLDNQQRLKQAGVKTVLPVKSLKLPKPGFYLSPGVHVLEKPAGLDHIRPDGLTFGPDVVLMPFSKDKEGIAYANSSSFPFCAAIFSESKQRLQEWSDRLRFGSVNFNLATTQISFRLPMGGLRKCGNHRPAGVFAQRNCCYPIASLKTFDEYSPERNLPNFPARPFGLSK